MRPSYIRWLTPRLTKMVEEEKFPAISAAAIANMGINLASSVTNLDRVLMRHLEERGYVLSEDQIERLQQRLNQLSEEYHDYKTSQAGTSNPAGNAYRANVLGDLRREAAAKRANKAVSDERKRLADKLDQAAAHRGRTEANLAGALWDDAQR